MERCARSFKNATATRVDDFGGYGTWALAIGLCVRAWG